MASSQSHGRDVLYSFSHYMPASRKTNRERAQSSRHQPTEPPCGTSPISCRNTGTRPGTRRWNPWSSPGRRDSATAGESGWRQPDESRCVGGRGPYRCVEPQTAPLGADLCDHAIAARNRLQRCRKVSFFAHHWSVLEHPLIAVRSSSPELVPGGDENCNLCTETN